LGSFDAGERASTDDDEVDMMTATHDRSPLLETATMITVLLLIEN